MNSHFWSRVKLRFSATVAMLAYLIALALLGPLLAWPLWMMLGVFAIAPEFHKCVILSLQLVGIGLLVPLHVWLLANKAAATGGGSSTYLGSWGLGAPTAGSALRLLGNGLIVAVAVMSIVAMVLLLLELRYPRPGLGAQKLAPEAIIWLAVSTAIAVALLEELWYRGGLQGALCQFAIDPKVPVVLVAAFYASNHFIRADTPLDAAPDWLSGFDVLSTLFGRFAQGDFYDSWLALFLAGLILGTYRQLDGNIWRCIGIHAGWVGVIQALRKSTHVDPSAPYDWLVGSYDQVIGIVAASLFAIWLVQLWLVSRAKRV